MNVENKYPQNAVNANNSQIEIFRNKYTNKVSYRDERGIIKELENIGSQGPQGPQGVPGPVGPAGLNWQSVWDAGTTYVLNDAVSFGGASWFCYNPAGVGPSVTNPSVDTANWALLAAQGAQGPQGPQGIQGPSGTGTPGTTITQTQWWTGSSWAPSTGLSHNGLGNVGINSTPSGSYKLFINANTGFGETVRNTTVNGAVSNQLQTANATFTWGIRSALFAIPNATYFQNGNFPIVFITSSANRLIIQDNGQVTIGNALATNSQASLVLKNNDIEIEEIGKGVILSSPNGTRYRITVSDLGVLSTTVV